jgi:tetratricopeptide (TPR) repeat protein
MRVQSLLGVLAVATLLAGLSTAQEPVSTKVVKPDLPTAAPPPLNTSATDVPATEQPKSVIPAPSPVKAKPAATGALTPKVPITPVIEIPDELKTKVNIATQHVRANESAEAVALFTEILAAKPDLVTISVERGKLYQQTKDHAKAIADFTSAITIRPDYVDAYFRRCVSNYETGAHSNAISDCTKAIELNQTQFEYYYYRGLAHTASRTWDKAAADLAAATERSNDQPDAHLQLARVYFEMDQLVLSLREYTVAIQQRPGFTEAYKGRSVVKAALGDATGSQEDLSKIAR